MMQQLIRQINDFAEQAEIIEPDAARRHELLSAVNDYTERFLETLPDRPAFNFTEDMGAGLYDSPITEEGMEIGKSCVFTRKTWMTRHSVPYPASSSVIFPRAACITRPWGITWRQ